MTICTIKEAEEIGAKAYELKEKLNAKFVRGKVNPFKRKPVRITIEHYPISGAHVMNFACNRFLLSDKECRRIRRIIRRILGDTEFYCNPQG